VNSATGSNKLHSQCLNYPCLVHEIDADEEIKVAELKNKIEVNQTA
jgi:hypothetical protein